VRKHKRSKAFLTTKMADEGAPKKSPTKKKGLPPLSPRNDVEEGEDKPKPVRRKKKKPADGVENGQAVGEGDKPTPRRRAKPAAADGTGGETTEDGAVTVPKKKKKKPKPKTDEEGQGGEPPASDRSATSAQEVGANQIWKCCKHAATGIIQ
jgi:hypothetical protein